MLKRLLTRARRRGGTCFQQLEEREFLLCGRNLVELCPPVRWETKFINDELGYVGKKFPSSVEGAVFFKTHTLQMSTASLFSIFILL